MSPAGRFPVHPYRPRSFICSFPDCNKRCRSQGGLKRHARTHRRCHRQNVPLQQHTNHLTDDEGSSTGDESSRNHDNPVTDAALPYQHIRFHPVLDGVYPLSMTVHFSLTGRIKQGHHAIPLAMISLRAHRHSPSITAPKVTGLPMLAMLISS